MYNTRSIRGNEKGLLAFRRDELDNTNSQAVCVCAIVCTEISSHVRSFFHALVCFTLVLLVYIAVRLCFENMSDQKKKVFTPFHVLNASGSVNH